MPIASATICARRRYGDGLRHRPVDCDARRGPSWLNVSVVTLMAAFSIAGCASPVYEEMYDWREGWRKARVERVGRADELGGKHYSDCRAWATREQLASAHFAVLSYENMSRPRRRVVPLHVGEAFGPGDLVYMNLRDCDIPLATRTSIVRN